MPDILETRVKELVQDCKDEGIDYRWVLKDYPDDPATQIYILQGLLDEEE